MNLEQNQSTTRLSDLYSESCRRAAGVASQWVGRGALVALAAVLATTGCHKGNVLGNAPKGKLYTILAVRAGDVPRQVTLNGTMIEKCPVAGCWLRLRDNTGTIKVDTKSGGFVVVNVPVNTPVTVSGSVVTSADEEITIAATGLSY
jgi:uncharacterized protein YdeI (BOF family)